MQMRLSCTSYLAFIICLVMVSLSGSFHLRRLDDANTGDDSDESCARWKKKIVLDVGNSGLGNRLLAIVVTPYQKHNLTHFYSCFSRNF